MKSLLLVSVLFASGCSGGSFTGTSWRNQPKPEIPQNNQAEEGQTNDGDQADEQDHAETRMDDGKQQMDQPGLETGHPVLTANGENESSQNSTTGQVVEDKSQEAENLDGSNSESNANKSQEEDASKEIDTTEKNEGNSEDQQETANSGDTQKTPETEGEKKVVDLCNELEKKTLKESITYEEVSECQFKDTCRDKSKMLAGNLERKDAHLQARQVQSVALNLPENAVLCEMDIRSDSDKIRYDDFLIFTLNDYILMLSNNELLREMPKKSELYYWDFEQVKGKPYGFDGDRHCLGADSECMLPGHDRPGPVNFSIGTESVAKLSSMLNKDRKFVFNVITTGDNDKGDCWHTLLKLDVELKYVIPQ